MTFKELDYLKLGVGNKTKGLLQSRKQSMAASECNEYCLGMRDQNISLGDLKRNTWFLKEQQVLIVYKTLRLIKSTMLHIFITFVHSFIPHHMTDNNGLHT